MSLGREVLSRKQNKRLAVYVPDWDGDVQLRLLSYAEVSAIQRLAIKAVDVKSQSIKDFGLLDDFNWELLRQSWVDEDGELALTADDRAAMLAQPNAVIKLLVDAIREFNGLGDGAAGDAEKN